MMLSNLHNPPPDSLILSLPGRPIPYSSGESECSVQKSLSPRLCDMPIFFSWRAKFFGWRSLIFCYLLFSAISVKEMFSITKLLWKFFFRNANIQQLLLASLLMLKRWQNNLAPAIERHCLLLSKLLLVSEHLSTSRGFSSSSSWYTMVERFISLLATWMWNASEADGWVNPMLRNVGEIRCNVKRNISISGSPGLRVGDFVVETQREAGSWGRDKFSTGTSCYRWMTC